MSEAKRNTDRVLVENVDCRILFTEQHQLGIDVGGSVYVRDPVSWHKLPSQLKSTEDMCDAIDRERRELLKQHAKLVEAAEEVIEQVGDQTLRGMGVTLGMWEALFDLREALEETAGATSHPQSTTTKGKSNE